jgi:hypothetical protein
MKIFKCQCGQRVFFDNTHCLNCGWSLGFDPQSMDIVALIGTGDVLEARDGSRFKYCENWRLYGNCNWLLPAESKASLCLSCEMNRVIPALGKPHNLELWTRVEEAKRRLVYSLLRYHLPFDSDGKRLSFRIMEDQRSNPDVLESFIATGHLDGTITVNVAEADDAAREAIREAMLERYRTVLGHLRHEAGHFYFNVLVRGDEIDNCRVLFGDERQDYAATLERYYANGPAKDWHQNYVSAYASAHPSEDFAETFAHVLHIDDALESAYATGLAQTLRDSGGTWIDAWVDLSITLNEVLRSLGSEDPYPFVLGQAVRKKLEFVSRLVNPPASPSGA